MIGHPRKTIRQVEDEFNEDIIELLVANLPDLGIDRTAEKFGVSKGTINYWIMKLGMSYERVVLRPGERYTIISGDVRNEKSRST